MILDLTRPTIVMLAPVAANVLSPQWIASVLLGIPDGKEVEVTSVVDPAQGKAGINFIGNIGFFLPAGRIEIFANTFDEETLGQCESSALKLVKSMGALPFPAYGINFRFVETEPEAQLLDALRVSDGIDSKYGLSSSQIRTTSTLTDTTRLNLTRTLEDSTVTLDFNFHHQNSGPEQLVTSLTGGLSRCIEQMKELMSSLYGSEDWQFRGHDLNGPAVAVESNPAVA